MHTFVSCFFFLAKFIQRADWLTEYMEPLTTVERGASGRPAGSSWAIIRAIFSSDLGPVYMPEMATDFKRLSGNKSVIHARPYLLGLRIHISYEFENVPRT
jgi:hypothetical protein